MNLEDLMECLPLLLKHCSDGAANSEMEFDGEAIFVGPDPKKMSAEERAFLLYRGLYIISWDGGDSFYWSTADQREDGDYVSYDKNLNKISP